MATAMMTREDLARYFTIPEKEVAKELGICLTSLKKICRMNGITRWPYRKMKSLAKAQRGKEKLQTAHLLKCEKDIPTIWSAGEFTSTPALEDDNLEASMVDSEDSFEALSNASVDGDGSERSKASTPSSPPHSAFHAILSPRPQLALPKLLPSMSASDALLYSPQTTLSLNAYVADAAPCTGNALRIPATCHSGVHQSGTSDTVPDNASPCTASPSAKEPEAQRPPIQSSEYCATLIGACPAPFTSAQSPSHLRSDPNDAHHHHHASASATKTSAAAGHDDLDAAAGLSDEDLIAMLAGCAGTAVGIPPSSRDAGAMDDEDITLALANCSGSHLLPGHAAVAGAHRRDAAADGECGPEGPGEACEEWHLALFDPAATECHAEPDWSLAQSGFSLC